MEPLNDHNRHVVASSQNRTVLRRHLHCAGGCQRRKPCTCDDHCVADSSTQDRPNFHAALGIGSEDVSIAEITDAMGREPDTAYDLGDPLPTGVPRTWSKWYLELGFEPDVHRGCYGLAQAIVDLGDGLADRAASLQARGCSVTIQVTQYIDPDDPHTDGIHVDEEAIAWLARAHASLDVDQYAEDATFPRAARVWVDRRMWNLREVQWSIRRQLSALRRS